MHFTGGFFQCGAGDMVKGYAGKYSNYKRFVLKQVGDEDLRKARRLVHLSNQIEEIQTEYVAKHKSSEQVQVSFSEETLCLSILNKF